MTDRVPATRVTHEVRETIHASFDAIDVKGRQFGARARITVIEFRTPVDGEPGYYRVSPETFGRWFHVNPHATRDGIDYGAFHAGKSFRTEDEARAYIAAYFVAAEKRALKNKARAA